MGVAGPGLLVKDQVHLEHCSPARGWNQEYFPKSDRLLLFAKLYLIQWVFFFSCTVDFPNVINFNIKEPRELDCLFLFSQAAGVGVPGSSSTCQGRPAAVWLKALRVEDCWVQRSLFCLCSLGSNSS